MKTKTFEQKIMKKILFFNFTDFFLEILHKRYEGSVDYACKVSLSFFGHRSFRVRHVNIFFFFFPGLTACKASRCCSKKDNLVRINITFLDALIVELVVLRVPSI